MAQDRAARIAGRPGRQAAAVAAAVALVSVCNVWNRRIRATLNDAAPLLGHLDLRLSALTLLPVVAGAVGVVVAPSLAERLPWRWLLFGTWLLATCWAFALAGADGARAIVYPLTRPGEYLPDLVHVHGLAAYLAHFTEHVHAPPAGEFVWSSHVSGGPPGPLLIFSLLDRIGLGGRVWATLLVVLAGTSAAPAVALTARHVAGEEQARRAAPFLALAPFAVWVATSADALFLGISAWGIALLAAAAARDRDRDALLGGLVLGAALFCSYGVAPLGGLAVAVVICARRVRPLLVGAVGVSAVAAAFAGFGFWWWSGLTATRLRYAQGLAHLRPYDYFVVADLGALAIAVGPAAVAGLATMPRRSRLWWPVGGALLAVVVADLSGLSKAEVERIWLPFAIWLLLPAAALGTRAARRAWLAAQVTLGIVLQVVLVTLW